MASADQIAQARRLTDEPTIETYSDQMLSDYIDEHGLYVASALIWREKAAYYAKLVNTSEGSARRDLSDLHRNALSLAGQLDAIKDGGAVATGPRVKKIVRA